MKQRSANSSTAKPSTSVIGMAIAPSYIVRGDNAVQQSGEWLARLGNRPLIVGGTRTLEAVCPTLLPILEARSLSSAQATYGADCSEAGLVAMHQAAEAHQADFVIGVGGGKALDAAKLLAYQRQIPVATIPTSAATCAAWTALSNIYSEQGAYLYDVALPLCPDVLIVDYGIISTASPRTLVAGIGDALAKWYEASVSSGHSEQTILVSAVQQARILRDLLFQKSTTALQQPGSQTWKDVVDASVMLAGVVGGLGGAQCRTVAAHAVHNGLTQLIASHNILHGEKVAYGILVQLRLEELLQGNGLAATSRQQLLAFYDAIGLPKSLSDLGLTQITIDELQQVAEFACQPQSDIHHLPFTVNAVQLMAAMVSTTAPNSLPTSEFSMMSTPFGASSAEPSYSLKNEVNQ